MTTSTDTSRINAHQGLENVPLLVAFQRGDLRAFEELYVAHSAALFAYGNKLCADHQLVADAVQDVFVDSWTQRGTMNNVQQLRFYLFKMLRNKLARVHKNAANFQSDDTLATHQLPTEPSVEQRIVQQETHDQQQRNVQRAIAELPERQREAVMLAFYHNFTNDQIAGIMGISHQSVLNHLNRAFKFLRSVVSFVRMTGFLIAFFD